MKSVLGTFLVVSGKIRVSDPCYDLTEAYAYTMPAANGLWKARITGTDRVASLVAESTVVKTKEPWTQIGNVGVDGGVMSIFDLKFYRQPSEAEGQKQPDWMTKRRSKEEGELFYGACCALSSCGDGDGGVLAHGVAAVSGYGDGVYPVYVKKFNGKVVAVKVRF